MLDMFELCQQCSRHLCSVLTEADRTVNSEQVGIRNLLNKLC